MAESQDTPQQAATGSTKLFPVPINTVKELLELAGDTVTAHTNDQYLPDEDASNIQGDQRKQPRPCLVNLSTTHKSNNCMLLVARFETGFRVKLCCLAVEYVKRPKPALVYITFIPQTLEWHIALCSLFQPADSTMQQDTV